jgi:hypothetical protein
VAAPSFKIANDELLRDGKPIQIRSGSLHYSRVPHEYWPDRLQRMRALGLNSVTTYVPWNFHESTEGDFSFTGAADLGAFLSATARAELLVILRAGPYMCGEWEFGGFPAWLLTKPGVQFRTNETSYLAAIDSWWGELLPRVKPHLYSAGGSIIMVQIENEFDGWGSARTPQGHAYMNFLYDKASGILGTDVIYSTVDGADPGAPFENDSRVFATVDGGLSDGPGAYMQSWKQQKAFNAPGNSPRMWTELWEGWFTTWGQSTAQENKTAEEVGAGVAAMLAENASFSLYMAHGGTNFGFWSGAEGGGAEIQPLITSYDYNAPIGESGDHTIGGDGGDVFAVIQSAITKAVGPPAVSEPPPIPKRSYGKLLMPESVPLLAAIEHLSSCGTHAVVPGEKLPTMEKLGQNYGFILYQREAAAFQDASLTFTGRTLFDRAQIFVDGAAAGVVYRDKVCGCAENGPGSTCAIGVPDGMGLAVLVENMGRINFGNALSNERKGIDDLPPLPGDWSATCLSLDSKAVQSLPFAPDAETKEEAAKEGLPVFRRGSFNIAGTPADTYIDSQGLRKGFIWINGHNLGRFWEDQGPQHALYCPAPFLRQGANSIVVLDLHGAGSEGVSTVTKQRWSAPGNHTPPIPTPPPQDPCARRCYDAGRCCQGNVSSSQVPSCQMGCVARTHTASLVACIKVCKDNNSPRTCDFVVPGLGAVGDTCQMCPCGCLPHSMNNTDASECIAGCHFGSPATSGAVLAGGDVTNAQVQWAAMRTDDTAAVHLAESAAIELHVDPATGPFLSVEAARDHLRTQRDVDGRLPSGGARVLLHKGTHAPFVLDPVRDSGALGAPITYAAFGDGPAVVSGGVQVPASAFTPAAGKPGVFNTDLQKLGLGPSDFGSLPDVGDTIHICDQLTYLKMQLFHEGTQTNLARFPNVRANGDWQFLHAANGGNASFSFSGVHGGDRVLAWAKEEEPYVQGYWAFDWADGILRITDVQPNHRDHGKQGYKHNITVSTAGPAGPGKRNARWFGLNLLSELDDVGEYHISKAGVLSYMPASPPSTWKVSPVVSRNVTCITIAGTQHVHIEGLEIAHCKGTGIEAGHTVEQPGGNAQLPGGITNVSVSSVTIHSIGGTGVDMRGRGSGIRDSVLHNIGCRAAVIHGGNATMLESGHMFATNNTISLFAQYKRTYMSGIHWAGVDNVYSHNTITDAPHNCMLGGGNEGALNHLSLVEQLALKPSRLELLASQVMASTACSNTTTLTDVALSLLIREHS